MRASNLMKISFVFCVWLFFLLPLDIFTRNSIEFSYSFFSLSWLGVSTSLIFLLLIFFVQHKIQENYYKTLIVLITAFALGFYCQANLLAWDYGAFDGMRIKWKEFNKFARYDLIFWGLLAIFTMLLKTQLFKHASKILIFLCLLQSTLILPNFNKIFDNIGKATKKDTQDFFALSKNNTNFVTILLDAYSAPVFEEISNNHPKYAEDLKDFIYFNNTLSNFTMTFYSLPSIFSANVYDGSQQITQYLKTAYKTNNIITRLKDNKVTVNLTQPPVICHQHSQGNCQLPSTLVRGEQKARFINESLNLFDILLFKISPQILKRKIYNNQKWFLQSKLSKIFGSNLKQDPEVSLLNTFAENINVRQQDPTFTFVHALLPHSPFRVNAECKKLKKPAKSNLRSSYRAQAQCALNQVNKIVNKIRASGVFDNTNILIMADHGVRLDFIDGNSRKDQNKAVLIESARPIFLFKPAQHLSAKLQINSAPLMLSDFAATVAQQMKIPWTGAGLPALSNIPQDRIRQIKDTFKKGGMKSFKIQEERFPKAPLYTIKGLATNPENWKLIKP